MILADSDIIIEVLRRRDDSVLSRWSEVVTSEAEIVCSPITQAEVWHGARPSEHVAIFELFETVACVPISGEIGRTAGDLLRRYAKSHGLGLGDALIAATTLRSGAALWTRNRKHYPMPELSFF
jgi:predicted nucleic acid-binding protein